VPGATGSEGAGVKDAPEAMEAFDVEAGADSGDCAIASVRNTDDKRKRKKMSENIVRASHITLKKVLP